MDWWGAGDVRGSARCFPRGELAVTFPPRHLTPCQPHRAILLEKTHGGVPLRRGLSRGPLLTLQACPSSRAALWASAGFSITLPVCPEKSIATREFSETLR